MQFPSITEITDKAQSAFKRFPVTLPWAIAGSGYVIYLIEHLDEPMYADSISIVLTLVLGVSWLIGTQFLLETRKNEKNGYGSRA